MTIQFKITKKTKQISKFFIVFIHTSHFWISLENYISPSQYKNINKNIKKVRQIHRYK